MARSAARSAARHVVVDVRAHDRREITVGVHAERQTPCSSETGGPCRHHPIDHRVALPVHMRGDLGSGDLAQRLDHFADADTDAGDADRARAVEGCSRRVVADDQVVDHRARRDHPHARFGSHRALRVEARKRLANDAARERRCSAVRPAGPHRHRRQPEAATVDVTLACHVVDEELGDRLLRAVRRLRVQRCVVGDRVGKRATEHGDRAREHEFRRLGEGATGFEQVPRRVDVDAHAENEIGFGLAADDRRKMEHRVRAGCQCAHDRRRVGEIAGDVFERRTVGRARDRDTGAGVRGGGGRNARWRHVVHSDDLADRVSRSLRVDERSASGELAREARAQEAACTGDDDAHGVIIYSPDMTGPNAPRRLTIATRESALALWQAEHVRARLAARYPGSAVELVGITTQGDRILDRPLAAVGGKGLFVKELEAALDEGRADLAVHSLKDVPMELPPGFVLAAITARDDPRDALVSTRYASLEAMPANAVVGTSSLRREAQLRAQHPEFSIVPLRGNVHTRLRKLDEGACDAIVLAAAGLKRLGLGVRIRALLDPDTSLPAPGQGALALECRADRDDVIAALAPLADAAATLAAAAERAFSRALGGSCRTPLAAYAEWEEGRLWLRGLIATRDGVDLIRGEIDGEVDDASAAESLGLALADRFLQQGAQRFAATN